MTTEIRHPLPTPSANQDLAEACVELVRRWLREAAQIPDDAAASRLAAVLRDPAGLDFTVGFVDRVIRPEDARVAARNFALLARDAPAFLPWHLRAAVRLGGVAGQIAPRLVIPVVRRTLRSMVSHLIIDATPARLGRSIAEVSKRGARLNVNLLGEAVLGQAEAARRLQGTRDLLERDDVDYVSIKVSSMVAPHSPWAFDAAVDHVVAELTPLYQRAAAAPGRKFINLDMEEYKDLDLTIAVFTRLLDQPALLDLEAGIVLQAYLPDSLSAMMHLQDWAARRRARGGARIKVRIVKGANLPMERAEASLHGWPLATWSTKVDTDTHYKRVIDYALRPEHVANVRLGVAGHNLFDLAFAWLLAGERGVREEMDIEMLLGMAQGQAEVVRREVGDLLLYTPVVHPGEFDVAIAYLIRRLEEGASNENFMSAVFELHDDSELFAREEMRFRASLAALDDSVPAPRRSQNRLEQPVVEDRSGFYNTPDTDPSLEPNRQWGRNVLAQVDGSTRGVDTVRACTITDEDTLEQVLATAVAQAPHWAARTAAERAVVLEEAARVLEQRRGELAEVMASETGKTLDQSDPEISEAIDFARYYAELARGLETVDGATFVPCALTVVTPPWNFPVAIPAGSTLAALAAGSAVIIKPAPQARRCGSVLVEALWEAGIPRDVLHLVHVEESDLGRRLVADPRVDRLILTGGFETAELFRSFRADLPLLAETSGKNAIVVTPSADLDLAAADVAQSAFGHAGQKCSAASLVILVGSVGESERFARQLVDAVSSLTVGRPAEATTQMGPIVEPASGKLLSALTTLGAGESWLIEPQRLDDTGTLWSPGVRDGVVAGSEFHLTEYFGPVLGIMRAASLEDAIVLQNRVDYGLTAGLHSLDRQEIAIWLERVEAGNAYVNRGITGAIVRRQPFGGWKKSAVGTGTKAGGPNYLLGLGDWTPGVAERGAAPAGDALELLACASGSGVGGEELMSLSRALESDQLAWLDHFGIATDPSALEAERNVFRYRPLPVVVRRATGGGLGDLIRVLAAGRRAGSAMQVSTAEPLPVRLESILTGWSVHLTVESDEAFAARVRSMASARVRLVGGDGPALLRSVDGRPDVSVHAQPVTEAGRLELLPFLREQSISITAHRFGTPDHLTDGLL
ncbi:bifunctional proline dehydrogenase/L-glutamate gamma-semialdehyde dehydrogenase [Nocardioides panaciterrulae]|uniref:L-glutamate gamma-semialdehyde dehydrogenase n=1 Tax=Nocardioides panaciterrulae TaxID=661492 RepID=A0A7Y9E383_9ACTN|nr:bifunctional proline dehydrogenase/L-glutamate gamma-semialdehyde dehydrogenase [Nocardioides panaciterrulae]NYD40230.1 RHH-type proline utilization regulon transcriptional repressor/proline dehydrogenase/delta 1-pyrroline-5-carboxylate dehydrogenase [Nocardioides panaciterrulae]